MQSIEKLPLDEIYAHIDTEQDYKSEEEELKTTIDQENINIDTFSPKGPYSSNDIPLLRTHIIDEFKDILSGVPEVLSF